MCRLNAKDARLMKRSVWDRRACSWCHRRRVFIYNYTAVVDDAAPKRRKYMYAAARIYKMQLPKLLPTVTTATVIVNGRAQQGDGVNTMT